MSSYTSEDINNTIRLINQDKRLLDMIMEVDGLRASRPLCLQKLAKG